VFDFLKNILSPNKAKPVESSARVETAPLSEDQLQAVTKEHIVLHPPQLQVGSAQSVGRQREQNEDTIFTLSAVLADGLRDLPLGIFIVSDGMGGHQNGELASGAATRTMGEYLINKVYPALLGTNSEGMSDSIQEIMENGVREAHRVVVRNAPGGGTTMTAALVVGEQVTLAHVGDSRAYFIFPDGRMQVVTQDHSLVHRLQELGQITEKEAAVHPQRNVLYRALGQTEPFRPDVNTYSFPYPGYLMMCSDGLWGVVPEAEIFRIVTSTKNPSIASNQLVEAANTLGGPDNISVVIINYLT
jgi:PPM family protein phosphatase